MVFLWFRAQAPAELGSADHKDAGAAINPELPR
jgi:hypothetical protein